MKADLTWTSNLEIKKLTGEDSFERRYENIVINDWLLQKRSKGTRRAYLKEVRLFFERYPDLSLKAVTPTHITGFLKSRPNLSLASQSLSKSALSSLFRYCVKIDYIQKNPADALDPIRVEEKIGYRSLTLAQIKRMIEVSKKNYRNYVYIKFLFYTGVRVQEAVDCKWENLRVTSLGVRLILTGKGNKVRTVSVPDHLYEELVKLKSARSTHFFNSTREPYGPLSVSQAARIVNKIGKDAGFSDNVSPHWLRHGHAQVALQNNTPLPVLQRSLGHSSLAVTGAYLNYFSGKQSGDYLPEI